MGSLGKETDYQAHGRCLLAHGASLAPRVLFVPRFPVWTMAGLGFKSREILLRVQGLGQRERDSRVLAFMMCSFFFGGGGGLGM